MPRAAQQCQWCRRLAWLIGIWLASVCALALVALVIRAFMQWAGMRSG